VGWDPLLRANRLLFCHHQRQSKKEAAQGRALNHHQEDNSNDGTVEAAWSNRYAWSRGRGTYNPFGLAQMS
jgi:hypothetical protein